MKLKFDSTITFILLLICLKAQSQQDSIKNESKTKSIEQQIQICYQLMPKNIYSKTYIHFLQKNKDFFDNNTSYCAVCDTIFYAFSKGDELLNNYFTTIETYFKANGIEKNTLEYYKTLQVSFLKNKSVVGPYYFKFNDNIQAIGLYLNGKKHGHWYFSPTKEYIIHGLFINGKKEGTWLYYKNNKLMCELNFKNDCFYGKTTSFYEDGTIWSENFYELNESHGKTYNKNGDLTFKFDKLKDSIIFQEFLNEKVLKYKIIYKNDVPYNLYINKECSLEDLLIEGNLENGNGNITFYYPLEKSKKFKNNFKKLNIKNGKLNGKVIYNDDDYYIEGEYKDNYMVNEWKFNSSFKSDKKTYKIEDSISIDNEKGITEDFFSYSSFTLKNFNSEFPYENELYSNFLKELNISFLNKKISFWKTISILVLFKVNLYGDIEDINIVSKSKNNEYINKIVFKIAQHFPYLIFPYQNNIPLNQNRLFYIFTPL